MLAVFGAYQLRQAQAQTRGANTVYYNAAILRQVAGATVFWATPIGPLRFNWTRAIQKEEFDEANNFEFTLSTRF